MDQLSLALLKAVRNSCFSSVKNLIDQGADPNHQPPDHRRPLLSAVEHEQTEIIRFLVQHGTDINAQDISGWTALHLAVDVEADTARQCQIPVTTELTQLLMELGADPTIKDNKGQTPVDIARHYNHNEAIKFMQDKQNDTSL